MRLLMKIFAFVLLVLTLAFSGCAPSAIDDTEALPTTEQTQEPESKTTLPQQYSLPYSWIDKDIEITIHGVFKADRDTEEGLIGEGKEQYKVLISYENISKQTVKADATVGRLKLKTSSENLYDPKYVGGESCYFRFDPQEGYQTHNYAFNIHQDEKPVELWKYDNEDNDQPRIIFELDELILPPTMVSINLGDSLEIGEFELRPLSIGISELIITGAYAGGVYYLSEAKMGYKFVYLEVDVANKGKERKQPPIYGRDGEFKVETDTGNIYQDIASIASLGFGSERWAGEASEGDKEKYPILANYAFELQPSEQTKLVKAFEIPEDTEPIEFTFRLLGRIKTVKITLQGA